MGKVAFLFPGQGSQTVGMGKGFAEKDRDVADIFRTADEVLGFPLSDLIFAGPQETLTETVNAQPAILTASFAFFAKVKEAGLKADYVAGHSLGEYTALVAAGALSFPDAVKIVRERGRLMEEAVPSGQGTMAAILGMDREKLEEVVKAASTPEEPVELANINCPGQIVISGKTPAVKKAAERAKAEGAKRAVFLEVSGPFHSSLMKPAAEKFAGFLAGFPLRDAEIPVIANVTAKPVRGGEQIRKSLIEQLYSPVLWEDSIRTLIGLGVDTFVEIGPGKVLTGLVKKIDRSAKAVSIHDVESFRTVLEQWEGNEE
jgi:[acyl-carrier-protein] S-malonyltransferase